jgi:hypothetical protein
MDFQDYSKTRRTCWTYLSSFLSAFQRILKGVAGNIGNCSKKAEPWTRKKFKVWIISKRWRQTSQLVRGSSEEDLEISHTFLNLYQSKIHSKLTKKIFKFQQKKKLQTKKFSRMIQKQKW